MEVVTVDSGSFGPHILDSAGGASHTGPCADSISLKWIGGESWAMSRLSAFSSPLLLGFEHFERTLDRISKMSAEGYPPYNIEQIGENRLRITLAVAGFSEDQLSVEVADDQLTIRGRQDDDGADRIFLHRGIAARQFQRSFVLADGLEVGAAELDNGLLHIDLDRPYVEPEIQTIEITRAGGGRKPRKSINAKTGEKA